MYGNETNLEKMNPIQNRIPHECPNCGEEWRPQETTDGTKAELQRRIKFLERQLLETATAKPQCTQEAFAAHVKGRVEEEVEKEREAWAEAWGLREAEWRRIQQMTGAAYAELEKKYNDLVAKNQNPTDAEIVKLESVFFPMDDVEDAATSMASNPNYLSFHKMVTKGRRLTNAY